MNLVYFISYLFFSVAGLILMKNNSAGNIISISSHNIDIHFKWLFLLGCLFYIISFVLWLIVISKYSLSYIYPIATSILFVLVMIGSFVFLREQITIMKVLASLLMLIGIVLIQIK